MSQANAIINVDINTSGAAASLRKLQTQINSFQSALNKNNVQQAASARDYSNQLSNLVNSSQFFSAETVRMRTSAGQLDETLSKGKGSIAQYFNSFRKGSAQAAQVMSLANARASALQTQFVATGAAAGGYRESLAIRPLQAFNSAAAVSGEKLAIQRAMLTQASTHMINFGKNTQWAGRQLMVGFTVPLSIFGALAGKTFMELEKQAISFKKVYGDSFTTPEELEENMKAVSKLSVEYTKYGIAASKTMELAAQAAAMGAQGATLTDAITESTKLATLGQMEQTKALETTIALQNAFGLSGEKLAKSVNFLNMVENQTVVTLQDLAEAIPRVAPVIKGLGGSVEDMAAMIAAMKEGGVSAAQGANALKSGLASLINPSNKASESLKKVGININQIVNTNRGDLMGTVQDFGKALSSLDKLGQQQALEKVFGKYQYARLGALFNNIIKDGTQASKVLEMTTMSAQQLQATADKELKVITDSPATKFTAALEKLKVSIAPIGEMFVKLATPIVSFISKIAEGFNNLPDFAKKFLALGTVLIGVVIPAGTMFLGLLMNLGGTLVKFTHIIGVALKGLTTGGLSGAVKAVSESLKYMSLAELDTSVASQQLAKSSEMVTSALLAQVPSATQATAAISALGREYATLAIRMREASALGGVPFVVPGAAFDQAGRLPTQTPRVSRRLRRNKGGGIPYLNDGGNSTVPGMGNTDTVPAMLTPGEFVVNKKATSANLPLLHAINSRAPGFNSGGEIPGMQYFGFRNRQRSVQPMDNIDVPMESFFASARNSMAKKVQVQSSTKSASLYDKLLAKYPEGTNSKVDAIRIATSLGIPVESLNLKSRGNFAFRMSDRANQEMMLGKLTRNSLLDELKFEGAHVPLERQMKSYFGSTFTLDKDLFNRIYREEIAKLPEIGINNSRFEKASRNSLTRYMSETGVPRDQRKNFIRDILQQDSVSSNLSKRELLRTLDMQGIPYRESGKDVYATVDGKEIKLGHLLGREIADLGRPKGIRPFAGAGSNIESPAGYANVHASKGGLLGRLGMLRGLFSTQGGLPGVTRGRIALNQEFKAISDQAELNTANLNMKGSTSGAGKYEALIPGLSLNRGHMASAVTRGKNTYHPGLMFWQTRGANQGLTRGKGLTGQQLLDDFNLIENSGMYPPSLMIAGARKLGLSSTEQEDSIKKAYAQIKEMLAKTSQTPYNNQAFTAMTEQILRESLEAKLFNGLYGIGTRRNSKGKSIGTEILEQNQGGMIPGMQYFATRIPRRVVLPAKEYPGFGTLSPEGAVPRPRLSVPPSPLPRAVGSMTYKDWIGKKVSTPLGEGIVIYAKPNLTGAFSLKIKRKHGTGTMSSNDVSIIDDEQLGINGYAHGGQIFESGPSKKIVPGVGNTDTVPAMLTPGEFVINKKATSANMQLLRAINNGTLRGYAEGDVVTHPLTGKYTIDNGDGSFDGQYDTEDEAERAGRARPRPGRPAGGAKPRPGMGMGRGMGISMGMGTLGSAMMMAPMIPGIGENAGLSSALSIGGTALSTASIIPMLAPMLAGLGAIAVPAAIVVGALGAVGAGLYAWRKSVDDAARGAAILGANLGGAANSLGNMSKILGVESPLDRRRNLQLSVAPEQQELSNRFTQSFTEGEGKAFIDKLKTLTSEKQFSMLSDYIKVAIASGMMDRGAAEVFAKSVGSELKNVALATQGIATAKGAGVGSKAMLALAQKREETVSKNAEIQMVLNSNIPDSVNSASAAKAIAASTQIMKDFSAAQVLAEEELRNNTLSYEEYRKIVDAAADATKTWGNVITKTSVTSDDVGATAQGSIQSMILAGISPEQVEVLANATDVGQTNSDSNLSPFNRQTTYIDENKQFKEILSGSLADVRLLDKVREAGFNSPDEMVAQGKESDYNKLAIDAVAEQSAALTMTGFDPESGKKIGNDSLQLAMEGAISEGMDSTQAYNLVKNILADPLGEAAKHFMEAGHSVQSFTESLSVANAEIDIPNLSDSQKTQYEDISNSLLGGFQEQFRTYIASSTNPAVALKNFEEIAGTGQARLSGNELDKARSKFFTDQEKMGGGSIANTVQSSKAYKDALQERKTVTEYNEKGKKVTSQGFDSTGVDKISNAVAKAQESKVSENVINYAVKLNGEAVDVAKKLNELTLAHNELIDLPEDFILGIGLNLNDGADIESFGKISDDLKMLIPTLDALPEEARAIMVNFGVKENGKAMSPEAFAKKSERVLKALKNLDSTKKSVKKSAIVSLFQEIKVNGQTMSKEQADSAYSDLIDKYGEKKIINLPGDVLNKVITIRARIEGLQEYISKLKFASAGAEGEDYKFLNNSIRAAQEQVKLQENTERATIASGLGGGGDSGSGGGGGEKSIAQQLKEQAKDSQEMFSKISKLQNAEGFKKFIAGPFAPEFLEYLRSQGAAGLKLIKQGLSKVKEAYANYQKSKISEGAAMAALTPQALVQESKKVALSSQYNQRLAGQGMSAEDIDAVRQQVTDEDLLSKKILERKKKNGTITTKERAELRAYNREQKRTERDAPLISQAQKTAESITGMTTETTLLKTQLDFINEGKTPELAAAMAAAGLKAGDATENVEKYTKAYNELKAAQYAADPGKLDQEKRDNLMEIADINRQIEEINLIKPLEDQVEVQQKIIDGQEKIVRGKQQEIDVIGRGIELKQRELEPLDDQIEKLQELSDKTSEAYDNQIEALDKIYEREAQIDKLKQGQLNVAQALSRGDVAGAAQAAMAASQDIAERSRQEARSALESQKEVSTQNIQNQILEIEKQKKAINKEIEDLQMKQRVIQDDIYRIQSTLILPAENEIYRLQGEINIAAEGLAAKYNNAATAMASLVNQLRLANAEKAILDRTPQPSPNTDSAAPAEAASPGLSQSGMMSTTSTKPVTIQAAAASAIKTAASAIAAKATASAAAATAAARAKDKEKAAKKKTFGGLMSYNIGGMMEGYNTGGNIGYRGSKEPPPVMMNYGGAIKKYIHGSIVPGVGMSDKVPAMLTPGEFIIRKSVSETYGPMLSALNSQVFPKMNLNSSIPTLGNKDDDGSVYNYQISVSLNGSNLDPNDVANAVMQKIKMSENKGVRSNNIRG